jgi:hypothetical protein
MAITREFFEQGNTWKWISEDQDSWFYDQVTSTIRQKIEDQETGFYAVVTAIEPTYASIFFETLPEPETQMAIFEYLTRE